MEKLQHFLDSLGDILSETTALEINTIIVEKIQINNFIAWEVYRDIYPINRAYLNQLNIPDFLHDYYLNLRKNLEFEYALLLSNPSSEFYNSQENLPILTNPQASWEIIPTKLPAPDNLIACEKLLKNHRFLRALRKVSEIKSILDNRNENPLSSDFIYAQTVIQLDGNIFHRYSEEILPRADKQILLQIHKYGVESAQKQWQSLIKFFLEIAQKAKSLPK